MFPYVVFHMYVGFFVSQKLEKYTSRVISIFHLPVQSTVRHVSDTTSVGSYIVFLVSSLVIISCAHGEGPSSVGRDLHLTTVSIKVFASSES